MNILITGAAGYIGSYLIKFLAEKTSHHIIPLYKKLPERFYDWENESNAIKADVTKLDELQKKIPERIDIVVHLAAFNNVDTAKMPEKALCVNGIGTRNMLSVAHERHCKLFIYFSVLQVYGKELAGTITVDSPVSCSDEYALNHFVAEEYCRIFSSNYGLNASVVRPSNVFGCPVKRKVDRWTLVPGCFCLSAIKKEEIRLKSSGKQNRDFVSLEYVSKYVNTIINNMPEGFNIYNLTSETLFSIIDVAKMTHSLAETILNKKIDFICESKHPQEPNRFLAKNNLLGAIEEEEIQKSLLTEIEKTLKILMEDEYE